jgi:hypothetical protein
MVKKILISILVISIMCSVAGCTSTSTDASDSAALSSDLSVENEESSAFSRTNPCPVGTSQSVNIDDWLEGKYSADITINSIVRGDTAWQQILAENQFNDPAADGMEYIIANVTVTITDSEKDASIDLSSYDFTPYSGSYSEYEQVSVVTPQPEFGGSAFAGGSQSGNIVFQVAVDDSTPIAVFGGSNGFWFKLYS